MRRFRLGGCRRAQHRLRQRRPSPGGADWAEIGRTSIDKSPVTGPVRGPPLGLAGDQVSDTRHHGGPDQAVYAFAREDLDCWVERLGQPIRDGQFGENLTTSGIDVNEAEVGERWRIGDGRCSRCASVRTPCNDFKTWMGLGGFDNTAWVKRFAGDGRPGPYLRVLSRGQLAAGDELEVVHRPGHGVTVALMFRALHTEPALLPRLLAVDGLVAEARAQGRDSTLPPRLNPAGRHRRASLGPAAVPQVRDLGYSHGTPVAHADLGVRPIRLGRARRNMPVNHDSSFVDNLAQNVAVQFLDRVAKSPEAEAFRYPARRGLGVGHLEAGRRPRLQPRRRACSPSACESEQRVGIAAGTRYEWILADLAVMCAGGATTTVYPSHQRRRHGVHPQRLRVPDGLRRGRRPDREAQRAPRRAAPR